MKSRRTNTISGLFGMHSKKVKKISDDIAHIEVGQALELRHNVCWIQRASIT